jgi:hypothetical protein
VLVLSRAGNPGCPTGNPVSNVLGISDSSLPQDADPWAHLGLKLNDLAVTEAQKVDRAANFAHQARFVIQGGVKLDPQVFFACNSSSIDFSGVAFHRGNS